jgi:hypothetical protein
LPFEDRAFPIKVMIEAICGVISSMSSIGMWRYIRESSGG